MPILKSNMPLPKRPVIIVMYGEPGSSKTSLANTANEPLVIDFDRGIDRAIMRKDTLQVNRWEDVLEEEKKGTFAGYKTIVVDTAKAALDDFLMDYVIRGNFKLKTNKLQMFGAIGDEFKLFVSKRRAESADIIIIAHAKDKEDGDTIKKIPDVTGGSLQLLIRIADQVGYISMQNNKRTIQFEPTDRTIGKNVARIPTVEIPKETEPELKTFMAVIIDKVRDAIGAMSEAQAEAIEKAAKFTADIKKVKKVDDLNLMVAAVAALPKPQRDAVGKLMGDKAKEKGWTWLPAPQRKFIDPADKPEKEKEPAGDVELEFS